MTLKEAVELILSESHEGGQNLPGVIRLGQDPGAPRMEQLSDALETIFQSLQGHTELDRHLAAALFTLGSDVPLMVSSWANKGHVWRREFMETEVYKLLTGVQAIFEGRRMDEPQIPTVH
ncbi:MAG TPA: hypothetical protein VNJ02_00165 [Vicinamibacterales bacterium]|nr:hypothetical protein [Vicinamibacterales bacterium]